MSLTLWVLLWASNTAFSYWVVWGGGASYLEGNRWFSVIDGMIGSIINWINGWLSNGRGIVYPWDAEQIAFYALLCWIGHTFLFLFGVFVPVVRIAYW